MTILNRIIEYLREHPEGVDDDSLTIALNLKARQQANSRCRRLEAYGIVTRRQIKGKIHNFLNADAPLHLIQETRTVVAIGEAPWFWEGNIQAAVVTYLENLKHSISFAANTATRQQGKDIIAIDGSGQTLWISVKGYPVGTPKTNPSTQARHWFSHALFDLILWRGESRTASVALALPDKKTYRNFIGRVEWFLEEVSASIYWVSQDGRVSVESLAGRANLR
jgi:hypothetical protein